MYLKVKIILIEKIWVLLLAGFCENNKIPKGNQQKTKSYELRIT